MRKFWMAALFVTGLGVAVGCSKKGPECESFTTTLNAGVDKMNAAGKGAADKPEAALAQAKAIEAAGNDSNAAIGKVALTVPELQKISTDYQAVLKDIASSAKANQDVISSAIDIIKRAEKVPAETKAATDELTKACADDKEAEDADECKAIADKVGSLKAEKAEEFTAFAAELDKLGGTLKQAETKAVAAKVAKVIRDLGKLVADSKALESKVKAAEAQQDAAIKKQNSIVESLNKFCAS